jgi:E3 ubiquitin-protein ligase UBR7
MFFSGQYNKNKQANEVNMTRDKGASELQVDDKTSSSLISNTNNSKNNEISATKTEESSTTPSTPVNNKRKIEDDEMDDECGEKIGIVTASKKPKNEEVNVCKRERWHVVSEEVEVDLFCVLGWRDELCHCDKCMKLYELHQIEFILGTEETYEPPEDDDAQKSLFDCGMKALNKMDRVTAIEGILAYNQFKDELIEFLKPFGESGKTVTVKDVNEFFEAKLRDRKPETGPFF